MSLSASCCPPYLQPGVFLPNQTMFACCCTEAPSKLITILEASAPKEGVAPADEAESLSDSECPAPLAVGPQNWARRAAWPPTHEFLIQIEKPAGSLGLDISWPDGATSLLIKHVNPGPVEQWNAVFGRTDAETVSRGDHITEVNGAAGDHQQLLAILKHTASSTLTIKFRRKLEYKFSFDCHGAATHGLTLSEKGGKMIVAAIKDGSSVAEANKLVRADAEIRIGDSVESVNGQGRDKPQVIRQLMDRSGNMELVLRRHFAISHSFLCV